MTNSPFIVGIDLGTTNCAVALVDPSRGVESPVVDFLIPQWQRLGEISPRPLLPSCIYLPGEHELPPGATELPWGKAGVQTEGGMPGDLVVGEFARWQGARVPGRMVASAKSWLCHPGVDRSAAILPWGAVNEVRKISPVDASSLLLTHIAGAWNQAHPAAPLSEQEVVITVPASFDEVARALTVSAAQSAGLKHFTLVEEPQAAFYDYVSRHRHDLIEPLKEVRLVLVVDVGGGTTDFTLIMAGANAEGPAFRRMAVGDHLMLGGDNMDAALARLAEERLGNKKMTATPWTQLVQACRSAKETLLGAGAAERHGISIAAEGSRLIGGTLSTELQRTEAERLILDGFFPFCAPEETPRRNARVALQELGLPYAQDPAVTRHLAAFLKQHSAAGFEAFNAGQKPAAENAAAPSHSLPRPDAILLNGGVFNSTKITERLLDVLSSWWPNEPRLRLLEHDSLELAVARGAAYYGLARRGLGKRIGGGTAQAFYVGIAAAKDSGTSRAVCLIPRGHEEGQSVDLTERPFTLTVGQPVQFPLFSTTSDRMDRAGDVVDVNEDLRPLPPIHTVFKGGGGNRTTTVPVHLQAGLTELGTLELWCVANATGERWRLEFNLREAVAQEGVTTTESMPARFAEVRSLVERVYGSKALEAEAKEVKQLARTVEKLIGPRDTWRLPVLRELWSTLMAGAKHRRRSADHERVFFQLIGYALRPGFGYPLDEWRCEQTFGLFASGVKFHAEAPVWNEFWILWRRIAGGLNEEQQTTLWNCLKANLARQLSSESKRMPAKTSGAQPKAVDEMVRTAASLENLEAREKTILGDWIIDRLKTPAMRGGPWAWALGRLGARVPLYGSSHKTVPAQRAEAWVSLLLEIGFDQMEGAAFATAQISRLTADRARNLNDNVRARVIEGIKQAKAPAAWLQMVAEVSELEAADEARALGDTLPIGLQLREKTNSSTKVAE